MWSKDERQDNTETVPFHLSPFCQSHGGLNDFSLLERQLLTFLTVHYLNKIVLLHISFIKAVQALGRLWK